MSARSTSALRPTLPVHRQASIFTKITDALALYSERRRLAAMPAERLADMGITQAEAQAEAKREFWDAPDHWKI